MPLEAVKRRIDRPLGELEHTVRPLSQAFDYAIAMARFARENSEEEEIEVTFQYLGLHSYVSLGNPAPEVDE